MDRHLLARATDSSDAATPGYMYLDIAKNAASSPPACQEIAGYLTRKLQQKHNHNIKFKCCKVIAQVAVNPVTRGQFKRCLAQDPQAVSAIKEQLQFRGPPDPARGDEIYERVRVAAKEALDAIYSDTPSASSLAEAPGGGMGGYASAGGAAMPSGTLRGTQGRMEGIGNPMYSDPRLDPPLSSGMKIKEVMREAGETIVGMIKDPLARNADPRFQGQVGAMPRPGNPGGYGGPSYPPGRNELAQATGGQWTMASNRGPSAITTPNNFNGDRDAAYYKSRDGGATAFSWAQQQGGAGATGPSTSVAGGVRGSWASAAKVPPEPTYSSAGYSTPSLTISSSVGSMAGGGNAAVDGSYERSLILELCPPGGMKAEPPPEKLASFARSVASLNPDLVCPALLDCLEDGQPWLIRAKALHVMEACIQNGKRADAEDNPYSNFFYACRAEIEPLTVHARAAIRDPAKRVLQALGITPSQALAVSAEAPRHQPPTSSVPAAAVPNLLDFDEDEDHSLSNNHATMPPPHAPPPVPPPASAPPLPSLPPTDPAAATDSPSSLFGGLKVQAPLSAGDPAVPEPLQSAPMSGNLLGDMPVSAGSGGLFADVMVKGPTKQDPYATDAISLFGDMTIKDESTKSAADEANELGQVVASNGSAFGFINQSPAASATSPTSAASSVPPKQSFDPLLNASTASPNTGRTVMHLSPEQMKAMAYQQMMMQQQLQMAMALQQQQQQQHYNMGGPFNTGMVPMVPPPAQRAKVMGVNAAAAVANSPFFFMDGANSNNGNNAVRKENDKRFDFVKDAMKSESKK